MQKASGSLGFALQAGKAKSSSQRWTPTRKREARLRRPKILFAEGILEDDEEADSKTEMQDLWVHEA